MVVIASETDGDVITVSVEGDLDTEVAAQTLISAVSKLLGGGNPKALVIDMSAVQLINSYGIGKIIMLNNKLTEMKIELRIKNPSKFVRDTFSLLLLNDILKFE